ncbi:hypothetical protein [Leucothrix pacifica]|uniref:AI-2E family transporter n=1 Tax=Leucothrix pacifica TaxID=1247513 RepID=A0A317CH19_9GAMM|nr:hypothetical protein [Leucothrix pacifica]PWQ97856.1 hypothetical protein DKW60_09260 [Leucothrix pacifica]
MQVLNGFLMEIPVNVVISVVLIYGYFGLPAMGLAGAALGSLALLVALPLASAMAGLVEDHPEMLSRLTK